MLMRSFDVINTNSAGLSEVIVNNILNPRDKDNVSSPVSVLCVEHDKFKKNDLMAISEYLLKITGIYHPKNNDMPYANVDVEARKDGDTESFMGKLILSEPPILELSSLGDFMPIGDLSNLGRFELPDNG